MMRTVTCVLIGLVPFVLAGVWPFACVVRGRSVLGSLFLCWALLIFWHAVLFLVLSALLYRGLGLDIPEWVPEGPAIFVGAGLFGWFPAAVIVFVADAVRYFIGKPASSESA